MAGKFPEFSRFSLIFLKKVPFSRFSRLSLSRTNPEEAERATGHEGFWQPFYGNRKQESGGRYSAVVYSSYAVMRMNTNYFV